MQVGLSDLKILTGHQGRNKPSLTDAPYIHTLGREYLSVFNVFKNVFRVLCFTDCLCGFIDLFNCIAASLFNKLTYLRKEQVVGCRRCL